MFTASLRRSGGSLIMTIPQAYVEQNMLKAGSVVAMVCPISSGVAPNAREAGFLVPMMGTGSQLHGSVHCHQLKTIDWETRKAVFVAKAPDVVLKEVIDCIIPVLEDD